MQPWTWNASATAALLGLVAQRYVHKGWAGTVRGISVLHAPSSQIETKDIVDYYRKAYAALREGGMPKEVATPNSRACRRI